MFILVFHAIIQCLESTKKLRYDSELELDSLVQILAHRPLIWPTAMTF